LNITLLQTDANANIVFDESSHRSCLMESADALSLQLHHKEDIHLSSFGSKTPLNKLHRFQSGNLLTSVFIVPSIAAPIQTIPQATDLPYLHDLSLAHPVMSTDNFKILLLIGANHYWDIAEEHIACGNGPTAMSSSV